jgi:hypothetical protein
MAFSIDNWNINPNRLWFVRLYDAASGIGVELYLSLADAQAQTNRQAHGISSGYGTAKLITLAVDAGASVSVSLFQTAYSWHVLVSGLSGYVAKIFQLKPFVDLPEISDPLYRNEVLIPLLAAAEINAHTHAKIERSVDLASHLPELEPGDIVEIDSYRLGGAPLGQVTEHGITGELDKLTSALTVTSYLPLTR